MDDGNVICESCEREVDDSLSWCPACGATMAPTQPVSDSERIAAEFYGGPLEPPWAGSDTERTPPADRLPTDPIRPAGPTPSSRKRGTVATAALVALALIGAGVGILFFLSTDSGDAGTAAGDVEAASLRPGDCWNDLPDQPGEILDVPAVPCDQPHDNEVFAVVEVPGAPGSTYPGMDSLDSRGRVLCLETFAGYTGELHGFSPLDIWMLFPTPSSWETGDREVICSLYRTDLEKMTGSARASTP